MGKKTVLYKLRRKTQMIANDVFSPKTMSKLYFRKLLGYRPDLNHPQTLNEKLQWLKLNYWVDSPLAIQCADKYAVREYITQAGKEEILNELLFVWDDPDEICWEKLPQQFVLKCNHGCGYNIICQDKNKLEEHTVKKLLRKWLKEDYHKFNAEYHYSKISRKIICEKYLGENVINYNIYCFNGKATFLSVAGGLGNGVDEHLTYYYPDGSMAAFRNRNYPAVQDKLSPLLPNMIEMAESLAQDIPLVRVDLFDVDGRIILSEMTFTPGAAVIPFEPMEADRMLGEKLDISEVMQAQGKR